MVQSFARFFFCSVLIGAVAATARGQEDMLLSNAVGGAVIEPAPVSQSQDSPPGLSVPDSPGATERLAKAREKEDQRQWKTAAEFYQEAVDKYGRRVVPADVDKTTRRYHYVGVAQLVQERLARWPEEGLQAYRAIYGQAAADQLAGAKRGDLPALDHVFRTYFVTDAGRDAGIGLMDLDLEAGRFSAAAWVGERLLKLHPALGPQGGMVLFRTAMAYHWAGDSSHSAALLDELKQKHPNDTGAIAGKDVLLVDELSSALQSPVPEPATQPADADNWPSYGGEGGRGEISASVAKPGAGLNAIPLIQPDFSKVMIPGQPAVQFVQQDQIFVGGGQAMGVMPVAEGGAIFFQDGRHVYAVNADSGLPLSGWLRTYGGEQGGRFSIDVFGRPRAEQLTLTVHRSVVLAVMGQPDRLMPVMQPQAPADRVVCLDRNMGKLLWSRSTRDFPDSAAALRTAEFNGTPRVITGRAGNDSVLVFARGGKDNQFEDCYVISLSLSGGEYQWSTYIGSASRVFDGEMNGGSQDASEMSVADGQVFVLSNLGEVAALNPYDGQISWLNSYPRDGTDGVNFNPMFVRNRMMNGNGQPFGAKPWAANPVMVSEGKVFILPADGKHLMVYDAGSGTEIKRILLSDYDNADVLLGIRKERALLSTSKGCYCINWRNYDPENAQKAIIWARRDVVADNSGSGPEENLVNGRGFLTSDSIFLPTRHRLYQIGWFGHGSGKVQSMYPSKGVWASEQGPGNVVVTSQNVIVAGSTRVDVYTDLELVRRQYEKEMAASPGDPEPRVRFAEVLFAGGQLQPALQKMDEAIDLAGGLHSMHTGKDRERIFTTALTFAQKSPPGNEGEVNPVTEEFFDRAGAAADSPVDQATYRLARAKFCRDKHDLAGEVQLCQQILSDAQIRAAMVSETSSGGVEAEAAITDAIREDPTCYRSIEQMAVKACDAAKGAHDPRRLLAVAAIYPNSIAAADARLTAAGLFESAGDHLASIDSLRMTYSAAGDPAVKARALEAIARNFLAMPDGVGPAIDRLTAAARFTIRPRLTQPLDIGDATLPVGTSFADAVGALRQIESSKETAALPDFHLAIPPPRQGETWPFVTPEPAPITGVTAIIHPLREFARNDRVITWSPAGLAIFPVGQTTASSLTPVITEQPRGAAWIDKSPLLWTSSQVMLADEAGKIQWKCATTDLHELAVASGIDAVTDEPEGSEVAQGGNAFQARRVIINGNGQRIFVGPGGILRINGANAAPAPVVNAGAEQIATVRPAGSRVLVTTSTGRVLALDSKTGQVVWQMRLADHAVDQLLANPHFALVRLDDPAGSQVVVLETVSGQFVGRRNFGAEGSATQLVNLGLSEEATAVFMLMNRLAMKDLYEPWKAAPVELTGKDNAGAMFGGITEPGQLIVRQGRVVAAYDSGKFVQVHDLAGSNEAGNPLATGSDSPAISLRMVGPRLFITNGKNLWQYNLEDPKDHYQTLLFEDDFTPKIRDLFLGRDFAMLLDDPIDRGPSGSSFVRLIIHRRGPRDRQSTRESGQLDYVPLLKDATGILAWQPVEGGVYYLSGDQKLHLLRGNRR